MAFEHRNCQQPEYQYFIEQVAACFSTRAGVCSKRLKKHVIKRLLKGSLVE